MSGTGLSWPWEVTRLPFLRQLLSYITKDKQTESLVEKLCQRFRTARYCLPPGAPRSGWSLQGPGRTGLYPCIPLLPTSPCHLQD